MLRCLLILKEEKRRIFTNPLRMNAVNILSESINQNRDKG